MRRSVAIGLTLLVALLVFFLSASAAGYFSTGDTATARTVTLTSDTKSQTSAGQVTVAETTTGETTPAQDQPAAPDVAPPPNQTDTAGNSTPPSTPVNPVPLPVNPPTPEPVDPPVSGPVKPIKPVDPPACGVCGGPPRYVQSQGYMCPMTQTNSVSPGYCLL